MTERPANSVDPKLLEILVCPLTKTRLEYDAEKRSVLSADYGVPAHPYEEYEDLLRSGAVDAVYIVSPNAVDVLMVTATQTLVFIDFDERRALPIPDWYRDAIRGFEGGDCEIAAE